MYKAIKNIGEYQVGDVVPDSKAELWLEMFKEPHVEKFIETNKNEGKPEEVLKKEDNSLNGILEDYLERNQSVVKKNVLEDPLSKSQLEELLKLEKSNKKRPLVINAIQQRIAK